jgi:hypothetical protein
MRSVPTLVLLLTLAGCGDDIVDPLADLTRVSGETPYDCNRGLTYVVRGAEVEPSIAIDPADPAHLVGAWQQDRWTTGAANGLGVGVSRDGGATWTTALPSFSACAGGTYARATDPWVTIAPDGTAYVIGLVVDGARSGVLVTRSGPGSDLWDEPTVLIADDDPDVFNDKESITADPTDAGRVYAVWDRLTGLTQPTMPIGTGPTMFARATDGVWDTARPIYDPGVDEQTIGNVIVVLPDGTLVDVYDHMTMISTDTPTEALAAIRSTDHGDTWSAPVAIAGVRTYGIFDADRTHYVRTGGSMPSIAVDPVTGAVHVAWTDSRFADHDQIALSSSLDGGLTWSAPHAIDAGGGGGAFTPTVAVTGAGTLGVTFFDLGDDPAALRATAWLATSDDGGATWTSEALTAPFELEVARIGAVYFLGDYQGLAATADAFVPFFAAADRGTTGPTDVFVRPIAPP